MKILPLSTLLIFLTVLAQAQVVSDLNRVSVTLKDGTDVTLFGRAWDIGDKTQEEALKQGVLKDNLTAKDGEYYYLPTNLRLAKRKDGIPEFLLLKYIADEKLPDRDMSGALMHFLMEWGLSDAQKQECEKLLQKAKPNEPQAKIVGPAKMFAPEGESFLITSAITSDKGLTNTVLSSGRAPLIEGGKIAVASNLNKFGAQLMGATLDKPKGKTSVGDLSLTLRFRYFTKIPALKGRLIIDWNQFAISYASDKEFAQKIVVRHGGGFDRELNRFEKSNSSLSLDYLQSKGVVILELDDTGYSPEATTEIKKAMLDVFTNSVSSVLSGEDLAGDSPVSSNEGKVQDAKAGSRDEEVKKDTEGDANIKNAGISDRGYSIFYEKLSVAAKRGRQSLELNYGMQIPNDLEVTANILDWYQGVKDNAACVSRVILNDPFFQRLNIRFILDKDMVDIFEQEVNYATVNIRKKRGDGADFTSRVTLDKKFVQENGIQAAVTYAGGGDKNPDMYEYQVQYSFRGGNVFPNSPQWQRGTMEAVTLYPPIKMHNVEFESDLEQMKEYKIARATMQIRYRRLGEEFQANLPISPAKGQPITSKAIFMDKDMKGFAYRIIYDHKEAGKLATEWEAKLGAVDYLYATIPEAYQDKNSDMFKKAKELGSVLTPASSTEGKVVDIVLDAFKVLFE